MRSWRPAAARASHAGSCAARSISTLASSSAPRQTDGVSVVATPRAERRPLAASRSVAERLLAAVPLASIYVWLVLVYAWESWGHLTPWLFTDELELTQLSR